MKAWPERPHFTCHGDHLFAMLFARRVVLIPLREPTTRECQPPWGSRSHPRTEPYMVALWVPLPELSR